MPSKPSEPRRPLWVQCSACSHEWICIYLPMDVDTAARVMKAHSTCPSCGGRGAVFIERKE